MRVNFQDLGMKMLEVQGQGVLEEDMMKALMG